MKNRFLPFSIRYLALLLAGLLLLWLRGLEGNPVWAILTPRFASPWELSKLVYWPMLLALALPVKDGRSFADRLIWPPAASVGAVLLFWLASKIGPGAGVYLLIWVVVSAAAVALAQGSGLGKHRRSLYLMLAVGMGALYVVLTFLPPMAGPFLDPSDVAAMATSMPC